MESEEKDLVEPKRSNQIPFSGYNQEVLFPDWEKLDPNSESFEAEDSKEPPKPVPDFVEEVQDPEMDSEEELLILKNLKDESYCLFYEDQLILTGTRDKLKNYLSEVILNDVPVESFVVLKKVKLNFGISLDE